MNPIELIITILTTLLATLGPILGIALLVALLSGLGMLFFKLFVVKEFVLGVWALLKELFSIILPKKWDSAKTVMLMGAFSWVVSLFMGPLAQSIVAACGWVFLVGGTHWVMHEEEELKKLLTLNGFFIAPWITGALICYFLFASIEGIPAIAFILWSPLSALIAGLPKCIGSDGATQTPIWVKPKVGDRPYLINLALISLLISCWIQMGFVTRQWLVDYPTLATVDISRSHFLVRFPFRDQPSARGAELLKRSTDLLKTNLQGQSWSQVERWLLDFDTQVPQLQAIALNQMGTLRENQYWQLQGAILPGEYNVQLFTVWTGPHATPEGFHFRQTCQIARVLPIDIAGLPSLPSNLPIPTVGNAKVTCTPMEGPIQGTPENARPLPS